MRGESFCHRRSPTCSTAARARPARRPWRTTSVPESGPLEISSSPSWALSKKQYRAGQGRALRRRRARNRDMANYKSLVMTVRSISAMLALPVPVRLGLHSHADQSQFHRHTSTWTAGCKARRQHRLDHRRGDNHQLRAPYSTRRTRSYDEEENSATVRQLARRGMERDGRGGGPL